MTTLPDRPNSALLVIDVQNLVVDRAYRRDEVVSAIAGLVRRARDAGAPEPRPMPASAAPSTADSSVVMT